MQQRSSLLMFLMSLFVLCQNVSLGQNTQSDPQAVLVPPSQPMLSLPQHQENFPPVVADGRHAVVWDNGFLLSYGGAQEPIALYDKTGKSLFQAPLVVESSARTFVQDAVPTKSGTAIVAVSAITADGAIADLILEVGRDGIRRAVRTSPFRPSRVCATSEGTVWAYGWERNADGVDRGGHHPMLREYSLAKGQLRTELDRATVQPANGIPISGSIPPDLQMKCGERKVVLINGPTGELMEYDLQSGKLTRRPLAALPEGFHATGAALTASDEIYMSALRGGKPAGMSGIFHLHADGSGMPRWVPITIIPTKDEYFILVGGDGPSLVYSRGLRSPTLFWTNPAEWEMTK